MTSATNKAFIHPKTGSLVLPEGIMLWSALFKARKAKGSADAKFQCNYLYHKDADLTVAKEEAMNSGKDKFSKSFREAAGKWPKSVKSPFKKTSENDKLVAALEAAGLKIDDYPVYIGARSSEKPGVVGPNGKADGIDEEQVYPGRKGRMTVDSYGYDTNGNKGVTFGLKNVQLLGQGDELEIGGSKPNAESEFDAVEGAGDDGESSDSVFD